MEVQTLKKPSFPITWLGPVIGFSAPLVIGIIPEAIHYGFPLEYILVIAAMSLAVLFFSYVFILLVKKHYNEKAMVDRCIQPGLATTIATGLCSSHVDNRNPTFVTADFMGHERDFIDTKPSVRRLLKEGDELEVLYNPKNMAEFIPSCFKEN